MSEKTEPGQRVDDGIHVHPFANLIGLAMDAVLNAIYNDGDPEHSRRKMFNTGK